MSEIKPEISSLKIILKGELLVNLPVIGVIISTIFILVQLGFPFSIACIISSASGWYTWGKLMNKWKSWGEENDINKERMFKLGKIGLINFYRNRIFDEESS